MGTKMAQRRSKNARAVVASIDTHSAEIGRAVTEKLRPHLRDGETMPDVTLLLRLFGRDLDARARAVVATDDAHERELLDDPQWRAQRDESSVEARAVLTDLRTLAATGHGDSAAALLGLASPPSFDPAVLADEGAGVLATLRDDSLRLPPPKRAGVTLNLEAFAAELAPPVASLAEAVAALSREAREAEQTLTARDGSILEFDGSFSSTATLTSAIYAFGGRRDLADRVRPSERRPGELEVTPEGEDTDTGGPAAG